MLLAGGGMAAAWTAAPDRRQMALRVRSFILGDFLGG
jgi:hypothetical protein